MNDLLINILEWNVRWWFDSSKQRIFFWIVSKRFYCFCSFKFLLYFTVYKNKNRLFRKDRLDILLSPCGRRFQHEHNEAPDWDLSLEWLLFTDKIGSWSLSIGTYHKENAPEEFGSTFWLSDGFSHEYWSSCVRSMPAQVQAKIEPQLGWSFIAHDRSCRSKIDRL